MKPVSWRTSTRKIPCPRALGAPTRRSSVEKPPPRFSEEGENQVANAPRFASDKHRRRPQLSTADNNSTPGERRVKDSDRNWKDGEKVKPKRKQRRSYSYQDSHKSRSFLLLVHVCSIRSTAPARKASRRARTAITAHRRPTKNTRRNASERLYTIRANGAMRCVLRTTLLGRDQTD